MLLVFLGAWYIVGIDQHARHATVWAPDGRVWHDVAMDRNLNGDLVLTDTSGERTIVPQQGAAFSYKRSDWYLGPFAWTAIVIAFGYATYSVFSSMARFRRQLAKTSFLTRQMK